MRVAIVHEWLESMSGSEQTFLRMASVLPQADLFALTAEPEMQRAGRPIRTTFLQHSAHVRRRRQLTLPVMPFAWRSLSVPNYDVVITSSHAFARWFPTNGAVHL